MTARARWAPLCGLMAMTLAVPAFAADARLERVVLLPSVDRSSIVFELTAEPRHVSMRRISDSVIEFEAGPGVDSVAPTLLKAYEKVDPPAVKGWTTVLAPRSVTFHSKGPVQPLGVRLAENWATAVPPAVRQGTGWLTIESVTSSQQDWQVGRTVSHSGGHSPERKHKRCDPPGR